MIHVLRTPFHFEDLIGQVTNDLAGGGYVALENELVIDDYERRDIGTGKDIEGRRYAALLCCFLICMTFWLGHSQRGSCSQGEKASLHASTVVGSIWH